MCLCMFPFLYVLQKKEHRHSRRTFQVKRQPMHSYASSEKTKRRLLGCGCGLKLQEWCLSKGGIYSLNRHVITTDNEE